MTPSSAPTGAAVGAIVLGAGQSSRMEGMDKIFTLVHGHPLIAHSLRVLASLPGLDRIALVLPQDRLHAGRELAARYAWGGKVRVCAGGLMRQDSARAGLEALGPCEWVVAHDGARPLVDAAMALRGLEAARETGAAVAAVPAKDTVKIVSEDGIVRETPPRESVWQAQTPQVFLRSLLLEAHRKAKGVFTDDAAMVESLGRPVKVFLGSYRNIKVTTPEDLLLVKALMEASEPERVRR